MDSEDQAYKLWENNLPTVTREAFIRATNGSNVTIGQAAPSPFGHRQKQKRRIYDVLISTSNKRRRYDG